MVVAGLPRFLDVAPKYAAMGWAVGPVCWPDAQGHCACGRGHSANEAGKAPLTPRGHMGFTASAEEVARLSAEWPGANLAVDLERSGLVVVDCDSAQAVQEHLSAGYPATAYSTTGKGAHFYYWRPPGCPATRAIHTGASGAIDVLSKGFVILPPSLHRTGRTYQWQIEPTDGALQDAPEGVMAVLRGAEAHRVSVEEEEPVGAVGVLPAGVDAGTLAIWEGRGAVTKEDGSVDRSDTLYKLACGLGRAGLSIKEITAYLALYDGRQSSPKFSRRRDAALRYRETATRAQAVSQSGGELILDDDDEEQSASSKPRAISQATWRDLYLARYPHTAFGRGTWRRYDGGVWREMALEEVERELAQLMGARATSNTVSAVAKLVRAQSFVREEQWDAQGDVLVCSNGTLELGPAYLRAHSPQDYATAAVPYRYTPVSPAPAWGRFLAASFKADVEAFLQEYAGYCLTTETHHELTLWLLSWPGAGKSTFLAGLETMLAGLYGVLSLKALDDRFALGRVPGKRLLTAAEQPSGYLENSDTLNALISGDTVRVERKYHDGYEFRSQAKIVWAMNERPRLSDPNNGIFRRVRIVQMAPIAEDRQDKTLKDQIRQEGPGILNWALQGLHRLRARGRFVVPGTVAEAVQEFKRHSDIPALFVEEMCDEGQDASESSFALHLAYVHWCQTNGYKAKSQKNVSEDWRRLGFQHVLRKGKPYWKGLALARAQELVV